MHVHDLHVWTMSPGHGAIQCHVGIESHECWPKILDALRTGLSREFGIDHVTVQPEWAFSGNDADCAVCAQGLCEEDFSGDPREAPAPELDLPGKI